MKKKLYFLVGSLSIITLLFGLAGIGSFNSYAAGPPERVDVLIGFTQTPGPSEQALVRGHNGTIRHSFRLVSAIAANIPAPAMAGLLANPRVTAVELDGRVFAIDAELDNTWGVKQINAGTVHLDGNKGLGVKVAVIDSGIDYTHSDLDANFAGGYDFVNSDTDPMDDNGHGTHVAGTIAAEDNEVGVVGVAPEASLYALKVLNSSGSGSWSNVIAALQWSVDNGIDIANLSLGSSTDPGDIVASAFENTEVAGVVIIAAAGNSGNRSGRGERISYPAVYESVIAVGATDKDDKRVSFSSTGSELELMAPGVTINSTKLNGGYTEFNGTSMASPHVAGSAALVIAAGITDTNNNGRINDEVRQVMNDTAVDLGDSGRDSRYGYGLVNVAAAVAVIAPAPPSATGTISGTVVDNDTLNPIEGASITDGTRQATTDANGYYLISDVSEGTYTVTASATGYDNASQTGVAVTADTTTTANFSLQAVSQATTVSVESITYATEGGKNKDKHLLITFTLVDDLGNPVTGAFVSMTLAHDSTSWNGTGTTGSNGTLTFSLKNAPSGCYESTVNNVTAEGLTWNSLTPANTFCK